MLLVGLTGGIGSGKSTVAARLRSLGCAVIDADQVAREVVEPGEPALAEIEERFGSSVIQAGALDRGALARIVFVDDDARRDLDRITHPRIAARIAERVAARAADEPDGITVVDHPLLVETGQGSRFDEVVVVLADAELRLDRLVDRGMDREDARARMRSQASDDQRRAAATHVLTNDGTLEELLAQVDDLYRTLCSQATSSTQRR